jgi:DNA-binding LacI/PurR family transcriptional regulator
MARALRTNRSMTIGVMIGLITDELGIRIVRGVQAVAHKRGYSILIGDTEEDPDLEAQTLAQFAQHQIDGLIVVDSWNDLDHLVAEEDQPPVIFVNLRRPMQAHNCVVPDDFRGGYEATRHLLDLGHRKVGYIGGPPKWQLHTARLDGYRKALEDYGLSYNSSLIDAGDWQVEQAMLATHRLLDANPDMTAIYVTNDVMAAGCIHAAMQRKLRIPQDLALVGHDDRRFAKMLYPPLTTVALPLYLMGQKATHLLIDGLMQKNTRQVPSIAVPGALCVRISCGADW